MSKVMGNTRTYRIPPAIKQDRDRRFALEGNPFEAMMERFDEAAKRLNLEPGLYKVLRAPDNSRRRTRE